MNMFLFEAPVSAAPAQSIPAEPPTSVPIDPQQGAIISTSGDPKPLPVHPQSSPWGSIGFMIVLFIVLYMLMIRPNQKREKKRKETLASLTEGDRVVTIGGIKGTVVSVKEDGVVIKSKTTEMEILKAAISHIIR